MSAPTDARVESIAPTSTVVRWTYGGSNYVGVHRSTDGVIFAVTGDLVASGTNSFTDIGLSPDTKYWYKLSDDAGATFSSVVTVVTHDCQDAGSSDLTTQLNLPRGSESFDEAMLRIEEQLNRDVSQFSEPCPACVDSDGKIIFDCASGCVEFEVSVDVDVNSITIKNCREFPTINWQCPGDRVDCGVGGWGADTGFTGDEGNKARFVGGRTMTSGGGGRGSSRSRSRPGGNKPRVGGGGFGGSTCNCVPGQQNSMTIKCCSSNCSIGCGGSATMSIKVCGGKGPYTISATGSLNIKRQNGVAVGSGTIKDGETINITPATNTGSGVAGVAYRRWWIEAACGSPTSFTLFNADFGCNDDYQAPIASNGSCTDATACPTTCPETFFDGTVAVGLSDVKCKSGTCTSGMCSGSLVGFGACPGTDAGRYGQATVTTDVRTAPMIAAGCNPCGVSSSGKVITATDSLGNSVAVTVKV